MSTEYMAPRTPLECQVSEIWETVLGLKNLSIRSCFFDMGGESLDALELISKINKTYSVKFALATLLSCQTIESMAELIQKGLAPNTESSIVPLQTGGSATPLFIIHGAGGSVLRFYPLATLIGTDHPVYGIRAQSLIANQPALLRVEDMATFYLQEIRKIQPEGPYYFLGYSFGGTVAYEMAQQLLAAGEKMELLGLLDARQSDVMSQIFSSDSMQVRFGRRIERFSGNVDSLSFKEKLAYLGNKLCTRTLRSLYKGATTLGLRSVPSFMKSTEDLSYVAAENYQPKPYPGCATLFRASDQPDPRFTLDLGWEPLIQGGIEICHVPGDHDLIFREPNIRVLAEQIRGRLERTNAVQAEAEQVALCVR